MNRNLSNKYYTIISVVLVLFNFFILYFEYSNDNKINSIILFFSLIIFLFLTFFINDKKKSSNLKFYTSSFTLTFFISILTILYGKSNIEFYSVNLLSSINYIENLMNFNVLPWFDGRSLGVSAPLVNDLVFNPILITSYFFSLKFFYILLWFSHLFLGILFFIKLNFLFTNNIRLSIYSGYFYTFSSPLICFFIYNDWTHTFISYTFLPIILYYFFYKILFEIKSIKLDLTIILLFYYYFFNSNIQFTLLLFIVLIIFLVFNFFINRRINLLKNFNFIIFLILILIFPRIVYLYNELNFLVYLDNNISTDILDFKNTFKLLDNFFPIIFYTGNTNFETFLLNSDVSFINFLIFRLTSITYDTFFVGIIFLFSSLLSLRIILQEKKEKIKLIFTILFILNIICLLSLNTNPLNYISNHYFGVFFIFLSIIISIYYFSKKYNSNLIFKFFLIIQIGHVLLYSVYGVFFKPTSSFNLKYSTNYFVDNNIDSEFYNWINQLNTTSNKKIILSPLVENEFNEEYYFHKDLNIFSIQNFYYKVGKTVFNDPSLQGANYPPGISKKNKITSVHSSYSLLKNNKMLDFLNIDLIIAKEKELQYFLNSELEILDSIFVKQEHHEYENFNLKNIFDQPKKTNNKILEERWVILKNYDGWNIASLNSQRDYENFLNCDKNLDSCNFEYLVSNYLEKEDVYIKGNNGKYEVKLKNDNNEKILILNKIFSKNWSAFFENEKFEKINVHGYLGIKLNKNINEFNLKYKNYYFIQVIVSFLLFILVTIVYYLVFVKNFYKFWKF